MKKIFTILFSLFGLLFVVSCNDQVNPKTDFKEVYALNCVIRGDTSFQIATISHSYDVDGYDPSTNTVDPFISGAKIKLTFDNTKETFYFRDTTMARSSYSGYSTPLHYYYIKNFQPLSEGPISIEATLPNGKVLKATSNTFYVSKYIIEKNNPIIPSKDYINFVWYAVSSKIPVYYVPELIIQYTKIQNGTPVELQKKVPYLYVNGDSGRYPLYPSIQADITNITFDSLTIRTALQEISEGDSEKQNYIIHKAVFRLLIADRNLAIYYAAQKTFLDEFSVRVTQPEFTNINGGLGIFGTLNSTQMDVEIRADYILSFGYRVY